MGSTFQSSRFRVQSLGSRVQGLGSRAKNHCTGPVSHLPFDMYFCGGVT